MQKKSQAGANHHTAEPQFANALRTTRSTAALQKFEVSILLPNISQINLDRVAVLN
jgi:hypothetical protein